MSNEHCIYIYMQLHVCSLSNMTTVDNKKLPIWKMEWTISFYKTECGMVRSIPFLLSNGMYVHVAVSFSCICVFRNVSTPEGTRRGLKALGHDISIIFGIANYYGNYPLKNAGDRPDSLSFFCYSLFTTGNGV